MRISEHVHALRIPFSIPVGPGKSVERFVYCFLIAGERPFLVDAGVADAADAILRFVAESGCEPTDIDTLVITHAHPDHLGGAVAIQRATDCRIAAHRAAVPWIEDVALQERERPVPGFDTLVGGSVRVDRPLEDGDRLDLGAGVELQAIHSPGHSRGQIALMVRPDGALISADALPAAGTPPIYEDAAESVASIERLMAVEGVEVLLSSWDVPREGDAAGRQMQAALGYIERVGEATRKVVRSMPEAAPSEIAPLVLAELGVELPVVPPMVVQSIAAHMAVA